MAAGPTADGPVERSGRVVDASGAPVPGALVTIVESTVPMPEIALQCDDDGRFSLRLPAGRFTFRAHGAGGSGDARVEGAPADDEIAIVIGR
jgi:protocatechuate 3,4-dioxygenase beta subunit